MFDVVVVGGGPAGLSAALMLGRCRRRVLVCDLGHPRNARSSALHGYLTRDGIAPAQLTELGRGELPCYGVELRAVGVVGASRCGGHFRVALGNGGEEEARYLLIATGVVDDLPAIPGLDACYGRSLFHCPYCDGWECRDRRLCVFGRGKGGMELSLALKTWSADVALCTHGGRIEAAARARLSRHGIAVRTERIDRVEHADGRLRTIVFASGDPLPRDAMFFTTGQHPQSDLAVTLGCSRTRRGAIRTGTFSNTNVAGVFVAGDASRDAQFAIVAAAEGIKAAVAINRALAAEALA